METANTYMKVAIIEAYDGIRSNDGGPFGALVVKDGKVVGIGHNTVLKDKDPTCHGEIQAIRDACKRLNTHNLAGCELYTTAYPCPMCLGAIKWANIQTVYYGCTPEDTDNIGFKDKLMYDSEDDEITFIECERSECLSLFKKYADTTDVRY